MCRERQVGGCAGRCSSGEMAAGFTSVVLAESGAALS